MGKKKNNKKIQMIELLILAILIITGIFLPDIQQGIAETNEINIEDMPSYELGKIPEYKDSPFVVINENKPNFTEDDYTTESFEKYAELDVLGRCGVAYANVCRETMPTEDEQRGDISSIRPTGWKQKKINGEYVYNRCHLIGYQLTNENANEKNLITGTRYFNVEGMLPFENEVANYIKKQNKTENKHVLYRVTPIFEGENLVASGVQMEAYSVEDKGKGICFNVYVYNVQPGINIDYATGELKSER